MTPTTERLEIDAVVRDALGVRLGETIEAAAIRVRRTSQMGRARRVADAVLGPRLVDSDQWAVMRRAALVARSPPLTR